MPTCNLHFIEQPAAMIVRSPRKKERAKCFDRRNKLLLEPFQLSRSLDLTPKLFILSYSLDGSSWIWLATFAHIELLICFKRHFLLLLLFSIFFSPYAYGNIDYHQWGSGKISRCCCVDNYRPLILLQGVEGRPPSSRFFWKGLRDYSCIRYWQ